jgi:RNA polymerase sigma-70 factor (ECF subfamily)
MSDPTPASARPGATADVADAVADVLADAVRDHGRALHALAFRMLGNHQDAEDAVQDAWVRALRGFDRFRGDASLATWLHRIVVSVCLDALRRRARLAVELPDEHPSMPAEKDVAEMVAVRAVVAEALASLPTPQRQAVVVTDLFGFDYAEAGTLLDIPAGTLGSRLHRARKSLRSALAA